MRVNGSRVDDREEIDILLLLLACLHCGDLITPYRIIHYWTRRGVSGYVW